MKFEVKLLFVGLSSFVLGIALGKGSLNLIGGSCIIGGYIISSLRKAGKYE